MTEVHPEDRWLYGTTWNGNESGTLWRREWFLHADGRGSSVSDAPGVYLPPTIYPDAEALRAAFQAHADEFSGRLA